MHSCPIMPLPIWIYSAALLKPPTKVYPHCLTKHFKPLIWQTVLYNPVKGENCNNNIKLIPAKSWCPKANQFLPGLYQLSSETILRVLPRFPPQLSCCNSVITVTTPTVILPAAERSEDAQEWSIKWGGGEWFTDERQRSFSKTENLFYEHCRKEFQNIFFMQTVMLAGKKVEQEWLKTRRSEWQGIYQGISHRHFAFWFCMGRRFSHKMEEHRQFLATLPSLLYIITAPLGKPEQPDFCSRALASRCLFSMF